MEIKAMENRLLDVAAAAAMLGISQRSVWRLRDSGKIPPAVRIGGCIRWRRHDIEAWIQAGCPDVRRTNWTAPAAGCGGACSNGGGHSHA